MQLKLKTNLLSKTLRRSLMPRSLLFLVITCKSKSLMRGIFKARLSMPLLTPHRLTLT